MLPFNFVVDERQRVQYYAPSKKLKKTGNAPYAETGESRGLLPDARNHVLMYPSLFALAD
ncbi:hypothetical protein RvY_10232 [Ramazzottius varieornatus]|uniref:Uncharacterized protein n=1 Tax=Ramazzottius varieornatus TaxID=947166 RepID=A0A1D1VHG5_RAMVA|nr:hypothetical protein RvY_10232 [Ramazzottius varieornatus]